MLPGTHQTLLIQGLASPRLSPVGNTGIGPGFSEVDSTGAAAEFIQYLDAARLIGQIAQGKQWSFQQLRLAAGQSVLDVGCGTGDDVAALAAVVGPGGRAVGLDSSEAMISEAVRRHGQAPSVSFVPGDAQRLPFDPATFDACRAERTLQHVGDPDRAVGEMARVLRPGGRVTLIEPDWEGLLIEGSDPTLSGAIWRNRLEGFRQPRVGRRLRALLTQHGFVEITLDAAVGLITDFDLAERNFEFANAAKDAVKAGIVSEQDTLRWLDELRQANRDGRFLCSALSFRAAGQKP